VDPGPSQSQSQSQHGATGSRGLEVSPC